MIYTYTPSTRANTVGNVILTMERHTGRLYRDNQMGKAALIKVLKGTLMLVIGTEGCYSIALTDDGRVLHGLEFYDDEIVSTPLK